MITIVNANAKHIPLADQSVQCIVTSPPYWGLRNYQVDDQIGLEPTPAAYVASIVAVMRECWRVLKSDGVMWLNLASSYSSGIIESEEYIMRDDLTQEEIEYVYQELARAKSKAMPEVWKAYAPAEQHVP